MKDSINKEKDNKGKAKDIEKDKDNDDSGSDNDPNSMNSKKNSYLNNMSVSQILLDDIDTIEQEIAIEKPMPPVAKKVIEEFVFNPNDQVIEDENIIYYTTSEGKRNVSFISLSLIANSIHKPTIYDYPTSALIKCLMEQKIALLSTDVIFDLFNSLFNHLSNGNIADLENVISLINYYIINNYSNDIAMNPSLQKKIVQVYELIQTKMTTITFIPNANTNINSNENAKSKVKTKDIIELFQNKDPIQISYLLQHYANIIPYKYSTPLYMSYLPLATPTTFSIFDWNMIEIARQLSLISQHLYHQIQNSELCNSNWMKGDKEKNAPNITKLIHKFNQFSYWICEEILSYDRAQDRARVVEKFIILANELRKMNNFNDCYNIITAFNTLPLKRLKKTWGRIKIEYITILKEINELCSLGGNFANLRAEYEKYKQNEDQGTGIVPYVGLFLKKLAFFDEGPKYFKDELINVDKVMKIGEIFAEIKYFQQFNYRYQPVFALAFLADVKPLGEDKLLELSNKLEPNFLIAKSKIKLKKRPANSDKLFNKGLGKVFLEYLKEISQQTEKTMSLSDKVKMMKEELKVKKMNVG